MGFYVKNLSNLILILPLKQFMILSLHILFIIDQMCNYFINKK